MGDFQIVRGIKKLNNNYNTWVTWMIFCLQGHDLWEIADENETTSLEEDSNGALQMENQSRQSNISLEEHNRRRDVRAYLRG